MIMQTLVPLLLFLPGASLLYIVGQRKNLTLSTIETLLSGSVLWNYIIVVPSLILGILANSATALFWPLNLIGTFFIVWSIWIIIRKRSGITNPVKLKADWPYIMPFMLLLPLLMSITLYHPLYYEWDAISVYLPTGRSIAETGELYNIYWNSYFSISGNMLLSIVYAWSYTVMEGIPHLLPFLYMILTAVSVFSLSKRLSGSKLASLTAILTFLSLPCMVHYLAVDSLLADLPFVFYMSASLVFVVKFLQERNSVSILSATLAACLAALTKPIGVVLVAFLLAILVMHSVSQVHRIRSLLCVLVTNSVFVFFLIWNFIFFSIGSPSYFDKVVGPAISTTILAVPLFAYALKCSGSTFVKRAKPFEWVSFILPGVPLCLIELWELLKYRVMFEWGPGYSGPTDVATLLREALASSSSSLQIADILKFISWYPIILSLALGAAFMLPLILGLSTSIRKVNSTTFVIICWFIVLIAIWSFFFRNGFHDNEYRRLLYFAPIVSVFVGEGIKFLFDRYHLNEKHVWYAFAAYVSFVWIFIWMLVWPDTLVGNIIVLSDVAFIPDLLSLSIFNFMFVALLVMVWLVGRLRMTVVKKNYRPLGSALIVFFFVSQVALTSYVVIPYFQYANDNSWDPNYYEHLEAYWVNNGIFEVIHFYETYIDNNYVTLGFRIYHLAYYANRVIIDLTYAPMMNSIAQILRTNDTSAIINLLYDSNIRYFLLPKPSAEIAYGWYVAASKCFELINMIDKCPEFILIGEFQYFKLYGLQPIQ